MATLKLSKSFICTSKTTSTESLRKEVPVKPKHEVFVGNLRYDISTRSIIYKLQELFKAIAITVPDFRFTVIQRKSKSKPRKFAFIVLSSEADENLAYQLNGLENLDFVVKGLPLDIKKRFSSCLKQNNKLKITFNGSKNLLTKSKSAHVLGFVKHEVIEEFVDVASHDKKELYFGQHLPVEDRVTEYKRGSGNYMKNMLIPHIRKYICAFLNSEGGRLMIGVDDDCKVYGISCNRKQEDQARCQIDNTIKNFQPHVLPHLYIVDFIPVKLMPNDNIELDSVDPLLKVLEVSVSRPNVINSLYENDKGGIFLRRDGSVEGPLKSAQIVEWCRVNFASNNTNTRSFRNKLGFVAETDDLILARQNYPNKYLEHFEKTMNETHKRIEEQLKQMKGNYELKEKVLQIELAKSKADLEQSKLELQSMNSRVPICHCIIL